MTTYNAVQYGKSDSAKPGRGYLRCRLDFSPFIPLSVFALLSLTARADRTVVDVTAGEAGAIKTALENAMPGTTLQLSAGWYSYEGTLTLDKDVWIVSSAGPDETHLVATRQTGVSTRPVVLSDAAAVLSGVDISAYTEGGVAGAGRSYGGLEMSAGIVTNCYICNHYLDVGSGQEKHGGGVSMTGGLLEDCLITNNIAGNNRSGGGVYAKGDAVIQRCRIIGNRKASTYLFGGGLRLDGTAIVCNSLIVGNTATYGAGAMTGTKDNRIINCTIAKNTAILKDTANDFGGVYIGAGTRATVLVDDIEWSNTTGDTVTDSEDPGFVDGDNGDFHIGNSAAAVVDAATGTDNRVGAFDLDLKGRFNAIKGDTPKADKGCYEFYESEVISVSIADPVQIGANVYAPVSNEFTVVVSPRGTVYSEENCWWTFDGSEPSVYNHEAVGTVVTNVAMSGGSFKARVSVGIGNNFYDAEKTFSVLSDKVFLVQTNPHASAPYATWETAATKLEDVLPYFMAGATLTVGDGTYPLPNTINMPSGATIRSVNGPERTTFDGSGVACLNVSIGSGVLSGIRLLSSHNSTAYTGGIIVSGGVVTNCIIDSATGGGNQESGLFAYGGLVVDCVITNCATSAISSGGWASSVGLAGAAMMDRCRVYASHVGSQDQVELRGAVRMYKNGGKSPILRNTLIAGTKQKGCCGIYASAGAVENCTVASNETTTATATSAGLYVDSAETTVKNTISALNVNSNGEFANADGIEGWESQLTTCYAGNDPRFKNPGKWNFHLTDGSPCVNTGTTLAWMDGSVDLDGIKRRISQPDIGCYELMHHGMTVIFR